MPPKYRDPVNIRIGWLQHTNHLDRFRGRSLDEQYLFVDFANNVEYYSYALH